MQFSFGNLSIILIVIIFSILLAFEVSEDILLTEKQVVLSQDRVKTFRFLSDLKNMRSWFPGLHSFEGVNDEPISIGKHFVETYKIPILGEINFDAVIMGFEPPRWISFISNGPLKTRVELEVERNDVVKKYPTSVTYKVYTRRRSYFTAYVLSPLFGYMHSCTARQALFALRYVMEAK